LTDSTAEEITDVRQELVTQNKNDVVDSRFLWVVGSHSSRGDLTGPMFKDLKGVIMERLDLKTKLTIVLCIAMLAIFWASVGGDLSSIAASSNTRNTFGLAVFVLILAMGHFMAIAGSIYWAVEHFTNRWQSNEPWDGDYGGSQA